MIDTDHLPLYHAAFQLDYDLKTPKMTSWRPITTE